MYFDIELYLSCTFASYLLYFIHYYSISSIKANLTQVLC